MKRIFLASSVGVTAKAIADEIQKEFSADKKRLLFITTASELKKQQDLGWQNDDRKSLTNAGFEVTDWTIAGKSGDEIQQIIETFDVIHFNGGNVFYLLKQLQLTNSIDIFRKAVESGKIYTGSSAGSMIASPNILPAKTLDKIEDAKKLKDFSGMAIVDFLVMPHWGSSFQGKIFKRQAVGGLRRTRQDYSPAGFSICFGQRRSLQDSFRLAF